MRIFGLDFRRAVDPFDAETTPQLRKRVQRLEIALEELQESHTALQGAHAKLRNQFHGAKGGRPAGVSVASIDDIPPGDKAALRLAAGIRPGAVRAFNK